MTYEHLIASVVGLVLAALAVLALAVLLVRDRRLYTGLHQVRTNTARYLSIPRQRAAGGNHTQEGASHA